MKVVLAYPPDFNRPTMIFGGLPLFSACLKNAGHTPLIVDINAEAFTAMLQPENLNRYFGLLDDVTRGLREKNDRDEGEEADYRTYSRLHVYPRHHMANARQFAEDMRDPEKFYDPELYVHMDRVIRTAHAFLHSFTPSLDPRNEAYTDFLYAWLQSDRPDPYFDYYESMLVPKLESFGAGLVALSCPFSPQVGTGMYFAKRLKQHMPDIRIVMGGTGMSDHTELLLKNPDFYDYVDYGIVGDGEEALPALVSALEGHGEFSEVAGLWRREGTEVIEPALNKNVDMDQSPTPDYTEVDFSHYMLPEPAGIYTTSRGCYYGKCTFCPESFRAGFRKRSPKNVMRDIRDMAVNQGVESIHFFDPLTPPVTLEYISRQIAREELPVRWYAEVKFEKIYTNMDYVQKLADGGCRQLQFGYESGVQRVLDGMVKGNRLDMMEVILDNLKKADISVAVTWFIGFPTEEEEDARESWRYMRRHWDEMHLSLYTGTFGLGHDVPVFYQPEEYGIEIIRDEVGNPSYRRLNGDDWDQTPLHETYQTRTDIIMSMSGAGLLYASHAPEGLYRIRSTHAVGPTSFDDPPIRERTYRVGRENHWIEPEAGDEDSPAFLIYVAAAGEIFEADAADIAILERLGGGTDIAAVLDDPSSPPDVEARLARFVDRGYIESPDPVLQHLDSVPAVSA